MTTPGKPLSGGCEPRWLATVGQDYVESAEDLAAVLSAIRAVFHPGLGEDLCLWRHGRELVAVWRSTGAVIWLVPAEAAG